MSEQPVPGDQQSAAEETGRDADGRRREALLRLGRTIAYAAPATLLALTMQANAVSADG